MWVKEAPRAWYFNLDQSLTHVEFIRSKNEQAKYLKSTKEHIPVIRVHVNYLVVTRSSTDLFSKVKKEMMRLFEMDLILGDQGDVGLLNHTLEWI